MAPILVTGATGYVGSHLIKTLLERGEKVRGTVRSVSSKKNDFLKKLPKSENLELVPADLTKDEGWDEAVKGCEIVHHVASPFVLKVNDPMKDLVIPALEGTKRVLNACARHKVKRVVLTSSCVAIAVGPTKGKDTFTEDDWNTEATINNVPYYYSKTVAERAAWEIQKEAGFEMVTINPGGVLGPALNDVVGESANLIKQLNNPKEAPIAFPLSFFFVDVRDVAEAHYLAQSTKHVNRRFILSAETIPLAEVSAILKRHFPQYRWPGDGGCMKPILPTALKAMSYTIRPKSMGYVLRRLAGTHVTFDNTASIDLLGVKYRSMEETLKETFQSFIEFGVVPRKGGEGGGHNFRITDRVHPMP